MSGTHLYYNGILFRDCELIEFDQAIDLDESRTDLLYSRYRITVASMLLSHWKDGEASFYNENTLEPHQSSIGRPEWQYVADESDNLFSMVDDWNYLRRVLCEPRKDFWFAINSTTSRTRSGSPLDAPSYKSTTEPYRVVLAASGLTESQKQILKDDPNANLGDISGYFAGKNVNIDRKKVIDANNGPKPLDVRIIRIDGGKSARVQFTIEICRPMMPDPMSAGSLPPVRDAGRVKGVISNRWSITESIDDKWRTNIKISGTLRVSDTRYKPDSMRLMTTTKLFPWAKLKSRKFSTTTDGLTLHYTYDMVEAGQSPPSYVADWDADYTERADYSATSHASVSAKVVGYMTPPQGWSMQQYKTYLFDVLMKIISYRIDLTGRDKIPGTGKDSLVKDFTLAESMKMPEVSASATLETFGNGVVDGLILRMKHTLGKQVDFSDAIEGYDPRWWPIPPAYTWDAKLTKTEQTAFGSVWNQYYQTPADEWHGKPRGLVVDWEQNGTYQQSDEELDKVYLIDQPSTKPDLGFTTSADNPGNFYWSSDQYSGFSYIQVEADNEGSQDTGIMALPLSKPRPVLSYSMGGGGGGSGAVPMETVSVIPIHAGVQYRTYRCTCKRVGALPKIPMPARVIGLGNATETLAKKRIVLESPQPGAVDGKTLYFTVHAEFKYVQNMDPDVARLAVDPRIVRSQGSDLAMISEFVDPYRLT